MQPRLAKDLADAAMELHRRRLWEPLPLDAVFQVRLEGDEQPLVAQILGAEGGEYGLILARGERALELYVGDLLGVRRVASEIIGRTSLVGVARWSSLDARQREFLRVAGVQARREKLVPYIAVDVPEGDPRPPNSGEAKRLLAVTRAVLAAAEAGELTPGSVDTANKLLELQVEGSPRAPRWQVRYLPRPTVLDELVNNALTESDSDHDELPTLEGVFGKLEPRPDSTWFVAVRPLAEIEFDDGGPADLLVVADLDEEEPLYADLVPRGSAGDVIIAFQAVVDGQLEADEAFGIAGCVQFDDPFVEALFEEELVGFGVRVELVEAPSIVEEIALVALGILEQEIETTSGEIPQDIDGWKRVEGAVIARYVAPLVDELTDREAARFFGRRDLAEELLEEAELDEGNPIPLIAVLGWLFLDHRPGRHRRTRCEALLEREELDPRDRIVLEAYRDAVLSIFRVDATEPGESIEVEDVLTGERYVVQDEVMSGAAILGIFIPMRVVRLGDWYVPSLAGPPLGPVQVAAFTETLANAGHDRDQASLRAGGHLFGTLWQSQEEEPPVLMNTDGELLDPVTALFRVADGMGLERSLDAQGDLERDESGGWLWVKPAKLRGEFGELTVLGRFEVFGDELLLEVNSAERLREARTWLDEVEGLVFERLVEPVREPATDDLLPQRPEPVSEELAASLRASIEALFMAKLDEQVPMFGGQTPREHCTTERGRRTVARWIRTMIPVSSPMGPIHPPRERMMEQLGLSG
ncbi:hypothetical protein [Engelhardtia mirabilis]|uniref:Antitoxin Xre/MbcA/ParS-like toxin-binding domain-containing protein n=1 Tax=Engelhardtia mirabilis TaxID=2528011 RepID=A0A518BE55_9BACT|nr:hypothetical protein Pla133_03060 [Planctomycetes bacterium Pla133]QDU99568.1 hypothetical protein Pla86_03060 [Planctomycetes bacterium Pla86]